MKLKIDKCRTAIIKWSRKQREENLAHLETIRKTIEEQNSSAQPDAELLQEMKRQLSETLQAEENYWKQRSRQLWLHLGDKNTGYFHASTKKRKAINKFAMIEDEEGTILYKEEDIAATIEKYFRDLFTTKPCDHEFMRSTLEEAIHPRVTEEQNEALTKIPTAEEIKKALFSINPGKAHGPDGFSACFFQKNWTVMGRDIIAEVQEFFVSGCMPRTINETQVRLIP